MADPTETGNTVDETMKAREEIKKEIQGARGNALAERVLAERLLKELSDKSTAAKEVRDVAGATGGLDIGPKRKEAVQTKIALVKVLDAVKEGIIKLPPKSASILSALAEKGGLTDTTASYLQPIIQKYINKDITFSKAGQERTQFEKDFLNLKTEQPNAATLLGEVINSAREKGELGDVSKQDLTSQLGVSIDESERVTVPEKERGEEERREEEAKKRRKTSFGL